MAELCGRGELPGSYGLHVTRNLMLALEKIHLKDASVLVIGSERPWIEACALSQGARKVTTLQYGKITSLHPQVHTEGVEALTSHAPMAIFSRAQFATPVSHVTNKVGVNFQRTKKSYALFCLGLASLLPNLPPPPPTAKRKKKHQQRIFIIALFTLRCLHVHLLS